MLKLSRKQQTVLLIIAAIILFGGGYYYACWSHSFSSESDWESQEKICVYLTGAVEKEGLYELDFGTRLNDLLNQAGLKASADLNQLNLAEILEDEAKIIIPEVTPETVSINSTLINLNTATQAELETLSGIGPTLAARIIEYRETQGNFLATEELKNVSGIGDKKYEKIAEYITVN